MRVRVLLVCVLMAVTLQAATTTTAAGLIGRWQFIPGKSKGGENFPVDTTLVVKQYGVRVFFQYWANNRVFQKSDYRTDGRSEKLYSNSNETAFVECRMDKNRLLITTHHSMGNEIGSQSFDDIDQWVLSKDGKTLAFKASDGRNMLFQRLPDKPAAEAAPAPAKNEAAPAPANK